MPVEPGDLSPRPSRPTSLMVFGILNVVFALLFFLLGTITFAVSMSSGEKLGPSQAGSDMPAEQTVQAAYEQVSNSPGLKLFRKASLMVSFLLGTGLLVSGVGLLRARPLGRTLAIGVSCASMVSFVGYLVGMYQLWIRPMQQVVRESPYSEAISSTPSRGGEVFGCCSTLTFLGYPLLLLVFMFTARIRRTFRQHQ